MYRYVEVLLKCSNSHTFPMSLGCLKQLLMDFSMIYTEMYSACVSWMRPNDCAPQFSWFRQQTDSPTLNSRHWLRQMLKLFWKHQRATFFTVFGKLAYNWFGYTVDVSPLRRYFCLLFLWPLEMTFIIYSAIPYLFNHITLHFLN